jgi:AcrR family transcriptional regulator
MSSAVKRTYNSTLRAAQARSTQRAIVAAAGQLFVEQGYGQTTVDAIAEAAGVSRKTVFTSVGGKVQTLKLALDWAIAGDDEPVPIVERPSVKEARNDPDARRILRGYAHQVRDVSERTGRLYLVMQSAAGLYDDVRELAEQMGAQRLRGMQVLAGELARRDALKPDVTTAEAADVLWLCNDPAVHHRLVVEQGWLPDRYEEWLAEALISLLIRPSYRPKKLA